MVKCRCGQIHAYDAYGNCNVYYSSSDTDIASVNPIRYRGYYHDEDAGLYYLNARYYNPQWRRFIEPAGASSLNPDSVNGLNSYCYAGNNPVGVAYGSASVDRNIDIGATTHLSSGLFLNFNPVYISKWQFNPNSLTDTFGHIENGFSILEGALVGYQQINNLPEIKGISKLSRRLMLIGIVLGLLVDAHNNFSNENLTFKEQCIGLAVDGFYTVGTAALSYGVSALVTAGLSLIPGVGVFAVLGGALVSIAVSKLVDWLTEENGWLDSIKDWIESW